MGIDLNGAVINSATPVNPDDIANKAYVDAAVISGVSGVSDINSATGSMTFTGAGVSQTGNTFTFSGGGGGSVTSVNTHTGAVVLIADDLSDTTSTHKFTNATDIARLANTSGTNTGDQTSVTGNAGTVSTISGLVNGDGTTITRTGSGTTASPYVLTAVGGGGGTVIPNTYTGLAPTKVNATKINFGAGAASNGSSNYITFTSGTNPVDISTHGAGGLDTGTATLGNTYYFYALGGSPNILIASTSNTYPGVTYPSGYSSSNASILPFALKYFSASVNGFQDFDVGGWPSQFPWIEYTDWDNATTSWMALNAGTATAATTVSLGGWMPGIARRVKLYYSYQGVSAAGTATFMLGAGTTNRQFAINVDSGKTTTGIIEIETTSANQIRYFLSTASTALTLIPIAYKINGN